MPGVFLNVVRAEFSPPWSDGYEDLTSVKTLEPLLYCTGKSVFVVPAGFTSDGASVPPVLAWAVPRWNRTIYAGLLHDYLIRYRVVPDIEADAIFYDAVRLCGAKRVTAWWMWFAVRLGSLVRAVERYFNRCGWIRNCYDLNKH